MGRSSSRVDQNSDGGVSGLKSLGVREMTYRMSFIAGSVIRHDFRNGNNGKCHDDSCR